MDQHTSSSPTISARYGQTCLNCAQSKCKCIIRRGGGPCERCRRLHKECLPAETIRRRNPRKPAVSKTARLEEKLDGLVSLIRDGVKSGSTTENLTGSSYSLSPSGSHDLGGEPSPVEAQEYLRNFQTNHLKYFPFIYIPSITGAQQLRQERPFLWLCIMAVGSKSTSQQQELGSKIRERIAQEIIIQSEINIDILLGLLTYIGWAHYQQQSKPFLAVSTQLAMSLVFELGLNKPVRKDTQIIPCFKGKLSKPQTPRTMEERRAVLGCFLVTSTTSSFLQKIDALRWTPHMDECLQILDERKEHLNDEILIQQVRLQLIAEKMALCSLHEGVVESVNQKIEHPTIHLESLQSQLRDIETELLARPQTEHVVLLHLYSAGLENTHSLTLFQTSQLTPQQQETLIAGLKSIESWLAVFFTITPAAYIGLSFSIFTQLFCCLRCLMTLHQLQNPCDLSWYENGVSKPTNPLAVVDRAIASLEQVAIFAGLDSGNSRGRDVFSASAQIIRSLRLELESRLGPDILSTNSIPQVEDEAFSSDTLAVDFFDNYWLTDLLLSTSY